MELQYELKGFSSDSMYSNERSMLSITWPEIFHAAITLGRKDNCDVLHHPVHSFYEIKFRYYMVKAFLNEENNRIKISNAYETLDPSEKSAINYFNGGIFTSIIARRIFNVLYLMHIDVYKDNLYSSESLELVQNSKDIRPDFVGKDNKDEYYIFESKARTHFSRTVLNQAYNQSKNINMINDKTPKLKLGCLTWHNNNVFKIAVKDPKETNDKAMDLLFDESEFFLNYYVFIFNYLKMSKVRTIEEKGISFIVSDNNCDNFEIGLELGIFNAFNEDKNVLYKYILENIQRNDIFVNKIRDINLTIKDIYIGKDGVFVKWFKR